MPDVTKPLQILVCCFTLTLASLWVIAKGAGDEPYHTFRSSDAYVQIGLAMILVVFWLQLGTWIAYAAARRRISRGWLALIIWMGLVLFYLWQSPTGYVHDISRYVAQKS